VPHQATTGPASRWTKPLSALGILSAAAVTTLGFAAPASAESNDYLNNLQPRYASLSASQLTAAGNNACAAIRSGMPASDATVMVSKNLGVSLSTAYDIVRNATSYLGC
jgi:hypothetical protein